MLKKIMIAMISLIIISSFSACQKEGSDNLPKISIKSSGDTITFKSDIIKQDYDNNSEDIANTFKELLEKQSEIVLVKDNEIVEILFSNIPPTKMTLYDHYIHESDGSNKFGEADARELETSENNTKYSFKIGNTSAELLDSNLSGDKYRGFRLICEWDDYKYQFAFVVKTQRISNTN